MCLPFCHKWEIKDCQPLALYTDFESGPATYLLYVCKKCGKAKNKWIWGHWTMDQLVGKKEEKFAPGT